MIREIENKNDKKTRYIPWECANCTFSNVKGTNLPENPDECRGKCSQCGSNVRNVYRHVERTWGPHGFSTRYDCLRFCDGLNAERRRNGAEGLVYSVKDLLGEVKALRKQLLKGVTYMNMTPNQTKDGRRQFAKMFEKQVKEMIK